MAFTNILSVMYSSFHIVLVPSPYLKPPFPFPTSYHFYPAILLLSTSKQSPLTYLGFVVIPCSILKYEDLELMILF